MDSDVNEAVMLFEDLDSMERTAFARITFPTVRLTIEQGTGIEIRWVFNFSKAEEVDIPYEEAPIETPPETTPDTTPPADVTSITQTVAGNTVTLSWTNPLDEDFSHVLITRNGMQIATNVTAGTYTESVTVSGEHTYVLTAVDLEGNMSPGASITVTI